MDIDKLPAKPFFVNDFKPLKNPVQQKKIDWDHLSVSAINLDTIPETPFRFQKSVLPKPVIVKAGIPKLITNTTSGVLQLSVEEGIPGLVITASLIDKQGMMWFATNKGLCRYTGENLYTYSFVNKIPQGEDYTITHMVEDNTGRLWLTTAGDGIYILDFEHGILLHGGSVPDGWNIICDHAGNIWVTSFSKGLYVINPVKETIKNVIPLVERSQGNLILSVAEDKYHNMWIGKPDRIAIMDAGRKHIKEITAKEGLNIGYPLHLFEDSGGDMWIGSYDKGINFISYRDKTINTINAYNGFNGYGIEYTEDNQGRVWVMRKDTIYILNKEKTAIRNIVTNATIVAPSANHILLGNSLKDIHGNIWIGSVDKGMIIIDPDGPLPESLDSRTGLSDNNVWGMMQDKNDNIWIGTYNGLNIYNPHTSQVRVLGKSIFGDNIIGRVSQYDDDNIFIATRAGFSLINQSKKTITGYGVEQGLSDFVAGKEVRDNFNRLWINVSKGIVMYDITKNSLSRLNKAGGLTSNLTWDMVIDRDGNIWAGSDSGINIINPANNTIKYLRESEGLCNNIVQKMLVRDNGEIWVTTQKGISIVNPDNYTITNLTAKEGLVPESIYDLAEQKNKMYAGSSDGLIIITKPDTSNTIVNKNPKWSLVNYGKREGFPYNDYNQNTGIATTNGQTWWGITPVLTIVTQPPLTDTMAPTVNVTGINIMDQAVSFTTWSSLNNQLKEGDSLWDESKKKYYLKNNLPKDSGYLQNNNIRWDSVTSLFKLPAGLSLPYNQNAVNISFTNNDIKGREKIVYRYILEGADEKWSDISDRAFSKNYFNLSPGQYTFKVTTKGFNGEWSKTDELGFTIRSPWWQTWWAYLLYIVLAAFITTTYARYRSRKLQLENTELENKIKERTSELSKSLEDLKSTQNQLIQSEKMASLGELTAGIAHEIQNPLNFVNNFSEVNTELIEELKIEKSKVKTERDEQLEIDLLNDIAENEKKINHHGKRADAIVKGMLQHSRSSGNVKESTDINALADEYLRLSYHGLRAKDKSFNATLKTDFDETIEKVNIIPQDIGRVLLNLYNNAFYAVAEKKKQQPDNYEPVVSVSTKAVKPPSVGVGILISVKDNGNGIPQNIVDKIFQPFFTTKPTGQGTGLGLSLSYDIIKAHGGEIKIETEESKGSAFIIYLPIKEK